MEGRCVAPGTGEENHDPWLMPPPLPPHACSQLLELEQDCTGLWTSSWPPSASLTLKGQEPSHVPLCSAAELAHSRYSSNT